MVTLISSCIHVYSFGYMHEELHDVTDPLAKLANGQPLHAPRPFSSLLPISVAVLLQHAGAGPIAGNLAMVFAFWELVGICSYLLIGFYIERKSASNAANKAFIVNRVGDFGMIIGSDAVDLGQPGNIFVRRFDGCGRHFPARRLQPGSSGLVTIVHRSFPTAWSGWPHVDEIAKIVAASAPNRAAAETRRFEAQIPDWRRATDMAMACWSLPAWASSAVASARARSSRCMSGCLTQWKVPRRSAR